MRRRTQFLSWGIYILVEEVDNHQINVNLWL